MSKRTANVRRPRVGLPETIQFVYCTYVQIRVKAQRASEPEARQEIAQTVRFGVWSRCACAIKVRRTETLCVVSVCRSSGPRSGFCARSITGSHDRAYYMTALRASGNVARQNEREDNRRTSVASCAGSRDPRTAWGVPTSLSRRTPLRIFAWPREFVVLSPVWGYSIEILSPTK